MRTKSDIIAYLSAKYIFEQKIAEISNQAPSNTANPLIDNDKSFFSLLNIDKVTELLESLKNVQEKEQASNNETNSSESAEQPETANTEVVSKKPAIDKALKNGSINKSLADFLSSRSQSQFDNMVDVCNNQNLSKDELMAELLLAATTGERDLTADQLKDTLTHLENEELYNFFKSLQPTPNQESEAAEKEQPAAKVAPQPEPEPVKIEQPEPKVEPKAPGNLIDSEITNILNSILNNDEPQPQPQPTQSQQPQVTVTSESTYNSITPRPTAAPGA